MKNTANNETGLATGSDGSEGQQDNSRAKEDKIETKYRGGRWPWIITFVAVVALTIVSAKMIVNNEKLNEYEAKEAERKYAEVECFIMEELKTIGELYTSEFTYSEEKSDKVYRTVFGRDIPLTGKSVEVMYSGKIKVGYNVSEVDIKAYGDDLVVLEIPQQIVENFITKEVIMDEQNNIFNPISGDDYEKLRDGVMELGLEKAEENGVRESAEEELKSILEAHFEKLGYKVFFH